MEEVLAGSDGLGDSGQRIGVDELTPVGVAETQRKLGARIGAPASAKNTFICTFYIE